MLSPEMKVVVWKHALRGRSLRERLGARRLVRFADEPGSRGNTGGANMPIFSPMPIPEDLRQLLLAANTESRGLAGLHKLPKE